MLNVCIGFDQNESVAYHVLCHSILRRASGPVSFSPIYLGNLRAAYTRPRDPHQSTDFTFARFLTPWLTNFRGISIFMDCDMLCRGDVYELANYAWRDPYQDVLVVKHQYTPKTGTKFLNQKQTEYPKKNWSSVMVFNGFRTPVHRLTPDYVNQATGMALHQFHWATAVGELPPEWNHLVGEYAPNPLAKLAHFTLGGPYFDDYRDCEFADEWRAELASMTHASQFLSDSNSAIIAGSSIGKSHDTQKASEAIRQQERPTASTSADTDAGSAASSR